MFDLLLKLFFSFLKVGSFSFGGAYSLIPLIERETVKNHNWLTQDEFLKVLGGVEVLPGAISIKFATYTGYKIAGIPGAVAANLGNMIMPAAGIILLYYFYSFVEKNESLKKSFVGIKYGIIGIIMAVMLKYSIRSDVEIKSFIFIITGFILTFLFDLHPAITVILLGIAAFFV